MTDAHDTKNSSFYVYIHKTADTGKIFYVGKGCRKRAYSKHRRNIFWERVVKKHGLVVDIVLDGLTECEALCNEIELIAKLIADGNKLTNLTTGGEGTSGYKWTDVQVEAHKNRCRTTEYRKAASSRAKKFHSTPEVKQKHAASLQAFWTSESGNARRDFLSASIDLKERGKRVSKSNWSDPATREKMLSIFRSAEYKQKLSDSIKVAVNTPKARENSCLARLAVGYKEKHSSATKKALNTPEIRERHLSGLLNPETQAKKNKKIIETTRKQSYREAQSDRIKKSHSRPEVRDKISKMAKLRPTVSCPHCGKVTQPQNAARWHFDKCKYKI